jgi:hypothetical protein
LGPSSLDRWNASREPVSLRPKKPGRSIMWRSDREGLLFTV